MQEWTGEVAPEKVHKKGQRGEEVEDEAVVFVGWDFGRGAGDGLEFGIGGVGCRWAGGS